MEQITPSEKVIEDCLRAAQILAETAQKGISAVESLEDSDRRGLVADIHRHAHETLKLQLITITQCAMDSAALLQSVAMSARNNLPGRSGDDAAEAARTN